MTSKYHTSNEIQYTYANAILMGQKLACIVAALYNAQKYHKRHFHKCIGIIPSKYNTYITCTSHFDKRFNTPDTPNARSVIGLLDFAPGAVIGKNDLEYAWYNKNAPLVMVKYDTETNKAIEYNTYKSVRLLFYNVIMSTVHNSPLHKNHKINFNFCAYAIDGVYECLMEVLSYEAE
ncbi:hypothetical protein [Salmonella phage SD-1_S14]|nr:hypothetical protein [Salmonella phage SD-1_S14]